MSQFPPNLNTADAMHSTLEDGRNAATDLLRWWTPAALADTQVLSQDTSQRMGFFSHPSSLSLPSHGNNTSFPPASGEQLYSSYPDPRSVSTFQSPGEAPYGGPALTIDPRETLGVALRYDDIAPPMPDLAADPGSGNARGRGGFRGAGAKVRENRRVRQSNSALGSRKASQSGGADADGNSAAAAAAPVVDDDPFNDPRVTKYAIELYTLKLITSDDCFLINTRRAQGAPDTPNNARAEECIARSAVCFGASVPPVIDDNLKLKVAREGNKIRAAWRDLMIPRMPALFPMIFVKREQDESDQDYANRITTLKKKWLSIEHSAIMYPVDGNNLIPECLWESPALNYFVPLLGWAGARAPAIVDSSKFDEKNGIDVWFLSAVCTSLHIAIDACICKIKTGAIPEMNTNEYHDVNGEYQHNWATAYGHEIYRDPLMVKMKMWIERGRHVFDQMAASQKDRKAKGKATTYKLMPILRVQEQPET